MTQTPLPYKEYRAAEELSDEELAARIALGNTRAEEILLGRYIGMVKGLAKPYFLQGAEREDMIQEGIIGLLEAIHSYSSDKQCSFHAFARLCVSRQILSAVKAYSRQKCTPLNSSLSLQAFLTPDGEPGQALDIQDDSCPPLDEQLISRERLLQVQQFTERSFSPFEKTVFELFMDGRSYQEISAACGRPIKSIDGALQRIRKKLARFFLDDEAD